MNLLLLKWFIILFLALSFFARGQVHGDFHFGYEFFPVPYYSPSNERNTYYQYDFFTSRYIFISALSPNLGGSVSYDFNGTFSLNAKADYTFYRIEYDVEDRGKYNYYPFGVIVLESHAFQFTPLAQWNISEKKFNKNYWKFGVGPFARFIFYRENHNQEVIDGILDNFPIGTDNMNSFLWGIQMQMKHGIRYTNIAEDSRYIFFGAYASLNSQSLIKRDETWIPSVGILFGVDF